jgi:hypothetical protein
MIFDEYIIIKIILCIVIKLEQFIEFITGKCKLF